MENYIVRIYRYEKDNPRKLIGTVEDPAIDEKKAFSSVQELWKILNSCKEPSDNPDTKEE